MTGSGSRVGQSEGPRVVMRLMARPAHFIDMDGVPRGGRAVMLLAYLLLERPSGVPRDELLELLWDPVPGTEPSGRLRNQIYDLNRHLPEGVLQRTGRLLAVAAERVDCDVLALREAMGRDDVRAVLDLYQSDVFDESLPRHAQMLEEWADTLRRQTQRSVQDFLLRAAEHGLVLEPSLYVEVAQRLLRIDQDEPDAWTHLVRAGVLAGNRSLALQAADHLDRLLAQAGQTPPREVREILDRARAGTEAPDGVDQGTLTRFIGRREEMGQLRKRAWVLEQGEAGGCVALTGPSGIGKTRLLEEVARLARGEGIRVLRTRAFETEWQTPNSILPSLMRPLLTTEVCASLRPGEIRALRPIMPGIEGTVPQDDGEKVGFRESVLAVLRSALANDPILLIVDDAHFTDPGSLEVLHRIAQEAKTVSLLLLLAFRDAHQRRLDPLLAAANCVVLRLSPFSPEEAGEALDSMGRFEDPALRDRLVTALLAASGGVPLVFLQQLVLLRNEGMVTVVDGTWTAHGALTSEGVGQASEPVVNLITRRLERLGDVARHVLAASAVLQHGATLPEVGAVAGLDPALLPQEVDTLVRERLLEIRDAAVIPAHAEIGEAALRALSPYRIQAMFAAALRQREAEPRPGSQAQTLTLLRMACGAGLGTEAASFLLQAVSALARGSDPAREQEEVSELMARTREWCATPALYARLHKEVTGHGHSARGRRQRIRELQQRVWVQHRVRSPWMQRILAAGVTAAILIPLGITAVNRISAPPNGPLFGGGGTLVLESQGQIRGLRIVGPSQWDTVPVPVSEGMAPSPDSFPEPNGDRLLHLCVDFRGPPEVCLRTGQEVVILAPSPGDDRPLGWAPDGSAVLMMSDRGSGSAFRYDIFVHDLKTGETRNLSKDPLLNYHANWSPDGTRIAYTIRVPGGDTLVVATTGGERIATWGAAGFLSGGKWSPDNAHLAVTEAGPDSRSLLVLNADEGTLVHRYPASGNAAAVWSPDGAFVTAGRGPSAGIGAPNRLHAVEASAGRSLDLPSGRLLAWVPEAPPPFLAAISGKGPDHLLVGESQRLAITGVDSRGQPLPTRALRIRSLDPALLRPVGGDTVLALAAGIATLEVDAGEWRTTRHSLSIHASGEPRLAFQEPWTQGIDPVRWRPYGTPSPEIVDEVEGGAAMRNNGDAHYPSGLVSVDEFSTMEGLALEWTQRTPLTGDYWQEIWVNLLPMPLDAFHTDEGEPFDTSIPSPLHLSIPIQLDSPPRPTVFGVCGSAVTPEIPFDSILTRTRWHRIAVQIFPSGGCDLYVDGVLVARGRPDAVESWPERVRLAIGGRSVGADLLLGELSLYEGIRYPVGEGSRSP